MFYLSIGACEVTVYDVEVFFDDAPTMATNNGSKDVDFLSNLACSPVPMSGTKAMEVLSAVAPPDIGEPALSPSTLELDRQVFNDNDYRANVCIV
ncbi:hypothetical protein FRC02_011150 [Tulasnella sp. 418]|nr:hypothetical protein FRC02_011150 [Tulasnella sp. 418]